VPLCETSCSDGGKEQKSEAEWLFHPVFRENYPE